MLVQPEDTLQTRQTESLLINLADFAVATNVLGPGRRAIIWVQGCPRRCPNCITPHMQRFDIDREWVTPAQLADRVLEHLPLEGVTFVGGEPLSHARQLCELVKVIRQTCDLSVVTYTGHRFARIQALRKAEWQSLVEVTDLLIDGEYIEAQACDLIWRGSANQQLHFLSPRYEALAPYVMNARGRLLEFGVDRYGQLRVIGIPEAAFFDTLAERLQEQGIDLKMG
jgi:anaerobic ribonucleoside-triphosphate reductase activating protein